MSRQESPTNSKGIYIHNVVMFSSECVKHLQLYRSLCMGGGTIFKVVGHKCISKKLEKFCALKWQL